MSDTTPFLKLLTGSFSTPAGGNPTGVMVENWTGFSRAEVIVIITRKGNCR